MSNPVSQWEKEFDRKFTSGGYWKPSKEWESFGNQLQADAIKSFIRTALAQEREKIVEMLEGMKEKEPENAGSTLVEASIYSWAKGFNNALLQAIARIEGI